MSMDTGVDPSPEEKRVYGQLFRQADSGNAGIVTGEDAVKFFEKTRLDSRVLGEIWQIADKENRGFLTPAGFGTVLRLIAHAQAGREPTPEIALQQAPIPRFDTYQPAAPVPTSPPPVAATLQAQGSGVRVPPLPPTEVARFSTLFERQNLQNGLLPGDQTKGIFERSGLANEALGKIWQLADTEQRGALSQAEFVIAMHLLTSMRNGTMRALPNLLPPGLFEAASRRGSASAPRQSPQSTGISAIPRQLSGTSQPRTGSPLGRPPLGPPPAAAGSDWLVTPQDKARFDQFYNDLDKQNKGFITGEEAVPFLSQSSLAEDALAQIWDLADVNSRGQLTRDEFAVAMYLIRQHRSGRGALPTTLPPNLIPPSLRQQARPQTATSAFDDPTPTQQHPPPVPPVPPVPAVPQIQQPKSALDDLFGLDSSSSSPVPPTQNPMSTGGSNADPFAGSSASQPPSSPIKAALTGSTFKPFQPSSSFGRGLTHQPSSDPGKPLSGGDDLLGDDDVESKNLNNDSTELANISNQIGSLSKQMQDTQTKRTGTQNELNQTNTQKANFEQRLAQLRAAYEKEAEDTRALEEQLRKSRADTQKLQGECMQLDQTYRDVQKQHQEVANALHADQQENSQLRERIRVVNGEIAQLKPQIDKLKSDARQQKGLVAINKKQLSTTEGERDKLKAEAEDLGKSTEDISKQAPHGSPASQVASPALSTASGNNPFFKRSASTDIMGAFASPPARNYPEKSFDDVFGPAFGAPSSAAPPVTAFPKQHTGASSASVGSHSTAPGGSPTMPRASTMPVEPPAPPESRQISSTFLPFPNHSESLSSSRQVSPPASRGEGSGSDAQNPFPGDVAVDQAASGVPGAFPDEEKRDSPGAATPVPGDAGITAEGSKDADGKRSSDPFSSMDQAKAKAEFDNAFEAFSSANKGLPTESPETSKKSAFDSEFPPISEIEREESDSESERGGFDDDFAPTSPPEQHKDKLPTGIPEPSGAKDTEGVSPDQLQQPSSPATVTDSNAHTSGPQTSTVDDIFGSAATGAVPATSQAAPSNPPAAKNAFDDDDDFEGLEDAKEGSADEEGFANISRSGIDDFNPVFDSSPPPSQAKSESTAFGNESSFDFVQSTSATGGPAPTSGNQQGGGDGHDWDAIFAGLDSPSGATPPTAPGGDRPTTAEGGLSAERPAAPGRALTESGEHDDPIVKNLTGMGYTRNDAVAALEKFDYNLEKAANHLAGQP